MSIYSKYILPKLLDRDMRSGDFNATRASIAGQASGVVLEIGFGSGYNIPFYRNVQKLYALEPSPEIYDLARERISKATFPIEYLQNSTEEIPLPNRSIDVIVSTWVLCSIPDAGKALREIVRVLKPEGRFIFVEHGLSAKPTLAWLQRLITPVSKHFTGNCHLDREIDALITKAGFRLESIEKYPEAGRPLMFSYRGKAVVKA